MKALYFWLVFLALKMTNANATNCSNQLDDLGVQWTKQVARTQAGGWIWFPGKGISKDKEKALLLAEGVALERMAYECNFIPLKTKINERCIESRWGEFIVHVRLSIKDKYCHKPQGEISKKFINQKLTRRHEDYLKIVRLRKYKPRQGCQIGNVKRCVDIANSFWAKKEKEGAYYYAGLGCEEGDGGACFKLGYFHFNDNNPFKSSEYSKLACWKSIPEGCTNVGIIFQNNGNIEGAIKFYKLACEKEDKTGCINLSSIFKKKGDLVKYGQFLYRAALIYKKNGNKTEYKKSLKMACVGGNHELACKKYKSKNKCIGDGCVFF